MRKGIAAKEVEMQEILKKLKEEREQNKREAEIRAQQRAGQKIVEGESRRQSKADVAKKLDNQELEKQKAVQESRARAALEREAALERQLEEKRVQTETMRAERSRVQKEREVELENELLERKAKAEFMVRFD